MLRKLSLVYFGIFILLLAHSCAPKAAFVADEPEPRPTAIAVKEKKEIRSEFEILMEKDSLLKHQTAAESLDILLNTNDRNKVSLMVHNESNCDLILRFTGQQTKDLPIYRKDKNFIVLEKGTYTLKGKLCRAFYDRDKVFTQSSILRIME